MKASISELIGEKIASMSASERKAAQTLVAHYPLIGLKTVADFSVQAGVSSPTILRFVARLGFSNYPEFQAALQEELAAQIQSPLTRNLASPSTRPRSAFAQVDATLDNIRETFSHLPEAQIVQIVALLSRPRNRIHLIGGRFTDPIARYMAAHLQIIRPDVVHLDGQESNWRDRLIDMGKRDVLVIFDIRRYQESLIRFAEKAQARGVEIVLLTDQWLSPIARFARHVLAGRTAVPSAWDSTAALFVVAETLIAEITRHAEETASKRIREMEELRGE
ncbi:RpiR family transcriptional regulator [Phyllobacterium phragmitis]|uniref:RpiR family transcriptional regulator n=2 Tax=Phyllobacterium phragmitis TaxID=2670329 RepID=A0A2S9IQI5_9HYPH|nr:MurR/RpiR family transcriptional regulator [Phyllobacterium phragmitis]PRD42784.1 RpiR family transcriptional regulator [Phyllobacterium phragmitis]